MERKAPATLLEAVQMFADPQVAHDYFLALRFPNGVACPRHGCGSADVAPIKNRNAWRCRDCNRQFTAKVGTIFEDSPIPFSKWLPAMWMLSACRNGVSSCEIARAIGVCQKTAWFMLHRLRHAMKTQTFERLSGEIEIDETFVGPTRQSMRRRHVLTVPRKGGHGPGFGKTTVMGFRQRGGEVRAFVVKDNRRNTLIPKVFEHVKPGATVYTDALGSYHTLGQSFVHHVINHAESYVEGRVHTNGVESFWNVLKWSLRTYIRPSVKHLDAYLDEEIYRFNERKNKDGPRFAKALKGADSRRLTWKALVRKG